MLHKFFTLDKVIVLIMNEEESIKSILIKLENISLSSGNGGADEEPVLFSQGSIYLLEYLPELRKNFSSK